MLRRPLPASGYDPRGSSSHQNRNRWSINHRFFLLFLFICCCCCCCCCCCYWMNVMNEKCIGDDWFDDKVWFDWTDRTRFSSAEDRLPQRRDANGRSAAPTHPFRPGMLYGCQQRASYRLPVGSARKPQTVIPLSQSASSKCWHQCEFFFFFNLFFKIFFFFFFFFFRFLATCRNASVDPAASTETRTTIMTQDVVDMAIQVVLAMLYLHRHRIVHRDVATRSCV